MECFWEYFHCLMAGHPIRITHLESIAGTLWPVRETCRCGSRGNMLAPGGLLSAWVHHYEGFPTDWTQLYGEDKQ
jgi:hypothetical protein